MQQLFDSYSSTTLLFGLSEEPLSTLTRCYRSCTAAVPGTHVRKVKQKNVRDGSTAAVVYRTQNSSRIPPPPRKSFQAQQFLDNNEASADAKKTGGVYVCENRVYASKASMMFGRIQRSNRPHIDQIQPSDRPHIGQSQRSNRPHIHQIQLSYRPHIG